MKKLVALLMALLLALGTCVALAEDAEEYTPDLTGKKIGISFYAYASTSAIRQLDYLIYCLEEAGAEVAYAIANSSVEQHLADIDSLIEQEIDALILDPCQTDGFESPTTSTSSRPTSPASIRCSTNRCRRKCSRSPPTST